MAVTPAPDGLAGGDAGGRRTDSGAGAPAPDSGRPGPRRGDDAGWVPTRTDGLSHAEVATRRADGRDNSTEGLSSRPLGDIIRANVMTPFNALLGALAALVLVTGAIGDALFVVIVVFNSGIGIIQEVRAKRTLDRLAVLSDPRARVRRDGVVTEIAVEAVVLDDLLELRPGDQVPADCRLRHVEGLEVDESLATGESDPVTKQVGDSVLSGTNVVAGSGTAQVTSVGADSFAHRLTAEARRFSLTHSELAEGINQILKFVAIAIAVVGPILFISQSGTTSNWRDAVRGAVAGVVGMVPEGLVLLVSVTFFAAALTLARRRVLVRELPSVEGLARVDVLCLDKTGTLTEGRVVFATIEAIGDQGGDADAALAALASDEAGNATMIALRERFPAPPGWAKTAAVPFSSARKWSAAAFAGHGTWVLGAPDILMPDLPDGAGTVGLARRVSDLASGGARTLLLARGDALASAGEGAASLPPGMAPVALVTFEERIRHDAGETLRYFATQGVAVKVISGDNAATVGAVSRRAGLEGTAEPVDARDLPSDPAAMAAYVGERSVFGRVTPEQKRSMVGALRSLGHVVAMTGDGVNDALALKEADIGVAMGSGTPAARAVAQLVLLDNEFSVLPGVVAEGRRVIANVERVANLFLTKNVISLVLALAVAVARWPFPFLPRHLTLDSTVMIGVPAFFLALGPSSQRFRPGFVGRVLRFAVPAGVVAAVAVLVAYALARAAHSSPPQAKTAATIVILSVSLWVLVIQARPLTPWRMGLVATMAGVAVLAFALPVGRRFYDLDIPSVPITIEALAVAAGAALVVEVVARWTLPAKGADSIRR